MTKRTIVNTFLPAFGGFYQSHWEQLLSGAEDRAVTEHDAYGAFEDSVDWEQFDEKAAAFRHEKTTAFLKSLEFDGEAS
jgi:hypothetical protein